jgi:Histone deacetylase domain
VNGTQGIFYERSDVLTVSIHADPAFYYPYVWGYAHERGEGAGLGANLNIPLPLGTKDDGYLAALEVAQKTIRAFAPGALVVALGLDASEHDPLAGPCGHYRRLPEYRCSDRASWLADGARAGRRISLRHSLHQPDGGACRIRVGALTRGHL